MERGMDSTAIAVDARPAGAEYSTTYYTGWPTEQDARTNPGRRRMRPMGHLLRPAVSSERRCDDRPMADTPPLSPDELRLRAISEAVATVDQAELALQEAVDAAREAGDPEDAILSALAARAAAIRIVVRELIAALGPTYVAAIAGAISKQHAVEWAESDGPMPDPDAARRLRLAHKVMATVARERGDDAARAWILSPNPDLGGDSPVAAIKRDRVRDVTTAVDSLLEDRADP